MSTQRPTWTVHTAQELGSCTPCDQRRPDFQRPLNTEQRNTRSGGRSPGAGAGAGVTIGEDWGQPFANPAEAGGGIKPVYPPVPSKRGERVPPQDLTAPWAQHLAQATSAKQCLLGPKSRCSQLLSVPKQPFASRGSTPPLGVGVSRSGWVVLGPFRGGLGRRAHPRPRRGHQ